MSKLITVFGATGNQGGSVIEHILGDPQLSKEYKIRGITRDTSKDSAQSLARRGVEIMAADLNSVSSLIPALEGSHTVFLVTNSCEPPNDETEFSQDKVETEFSQGKNVTIVAKNVDVSYIIFSSLHHVTESTKGRLSNVPDFDHKANIEKYIHASGLKCAFVLPGYYMSNFIQLLKKTQDGEYQLSYPVDGKKAKFPLFDAANDTGLFVKAILKNSDGLQGKQILEASDYYTAEEIVATFSKVTGKRAVFIQVTPEQYKASLHEKVAQKYLESHLFIEDPGYYLGKSLEPSLKLLDSKPTSWAEFVEKNSASWI